MRCIIRAGDVQGSRLSAFQFLEMHWVEKRVISAWAWIFAFIPWLVRNVKEALQKLHIFTDPFSAWIVSWSWNYRHEIHAIRLPWKPHNCYTRKSICSKTKVAAEVATYWWTRTCGWVSFNLHVWRSVLVSRVWKNTRDVYSRQASQWHIWRTLYQLNRKEPLYRTSSLPIINKTVTIVFSNSGIITWSKF